MNDDDPFSGFVFDSESGVMLPRLEATVAAETAPAVRREEPKWNKIHDAKILIIQGWGVGDVLEGEDATGTERVVITGIGEERVLGRLLAVKRPGHEWEEPTEGQKRERMYSFATRVWRKA